MTAPSHTHIDSDSTEATGPWNPTTMSGSFTVKILNMDLYCQLLERQKITMILLVKNSPQEQLDRGFL